MSELFKYIDDNNVEHILVSKDYVDMRIKNLREAIRLVADKIDLLLVIGSEESSNALSLVSAGKDNGIQKVVRIDSKEELTDDIFDGVNNMAIASAASVDIEIFNNIVEYIKGKNIFIVEEFNQECNNNFSDKSQNLRDTENNINIINETTPLTTQSPSNSL